MMAILEVGKLITGGDHSGAAVFYYAAAVAGITVHHAIFKKGEWHMKAARTVKFCLSACAVMALLEAIYTAISGNLSIRGSVSVISTFTVSLLFSVFVYRVFFHRLRHFPGPFFASVTKLWHTLQCLGSKNHEVLVDLHKKYGDFVRTGPSEVTIFDPESLIKLDGPGNKATKSPWYDFPLPHAGVGTLREKPLHDKRRRIWTKGMSTKQLAVYERHAITQMHQLNDIIAEFAETGETVDFSKHAYWFSFDMMGLFIFSRTFGMLDQRKWDNGVVTLRRAMKLLGPFSSVPWLAQIGLTFFNGVGVLKDWHTMLDWCEKRMSERIRVNSPKQLIYVHQSLHFFSSLLTLPGLVV